MVGLGLVVTRDGGVPLLSHPYPGNRPDVTQFTTMIDELCVRHAALASGDATPGEITVVFDAGQNSVANFTHLDRSGLHFVGSIPPSHCADLLKRPARARTLVDEPRFGGLTALQTRRTVYGRDRRVVLTHSPTLHTAQSRGFDQTLAKAGARLGDLAAALARGKTRRAPEKVQAEISAITKDSWVARVTTTELTGDTPQDLRLTWNIDAKARRALENEIFGKRVLVTDHNHWTIADIVAGYRSNRTRSSPSGSSRTPTSFPSGLWTTGPTTTSASTSSPAYSP
ncbi:hypothetical protein QMK19_36485 [Streptomyces sp. H10-C2]|uniref:IS1634 family transposase n=1 Tax=unclassified Streptomyces TaxID=2593676 RepID=UPI0024BA10B7|nr:MULTISPECIES: hypothetical protein [unclassified Streptomyces]MDJ0346494.1 hypothetical protein [Streptomyces sp. PH10-H1]MDJ0374972.1 hypothetical protein [Streptomyces sp. H10-C2]